MDDFSEKLNVRLPVKLFRIGEIAEFKGISRQTVHNYTAMGLITEDKRSAGGHRLYHESVFDELARIEHLKRSKTLVEIRRQPPEIGFVVVIRVISSLGRGIIGVLKDNARFQTVILAHRKASEIPVIVVGVDDGLALFPVCRIVTPHRISVAIALVDR